MDVSFNALRSCDGTLYKAVHDCVASTECNIRAKRSTAQERYAQNRHRRLSFFSSTNQDVIFSDPLVDNTVQDLASC